MEQALANLCSDKLVKLNCRLKTELTRELLNGSSPGEKREEISTLTKISKELSQRRIAMEDKMVESISGNCIETRKPPNE